MKKAIVTGGSGGIGLAIAKELAVEGFSLTLVSSNEDKLRKAVFDLSGQDHKYLVADLTKQDEINTIANHINLNHYDLLVNNAGIAVFGKFHEQQIKKYLDMIKLNCDATVMLSHSYLKNARQGDTLINIGSVLGNTSIANLAVYAGTKGFIIRFTESLWYEYRLKGIYVFAFNPGVTSSDFYKESPALFENFPHIIIQTPEQVAKECIKALHKRRKPHIISGFVNRNLIFIQRFMSRKAIVKMMGGFNPVSNK